MLYAGDNFVVSRPLTAGIPAPRHWDEHLVERPSTSSGNDQRRPATTRYDRAIHSAAAAASRRGESLRQGYPYMPSNVPQWRDDGPVRRGQRQNNSEHSDSYDHLVDADLETYMLSSARQHAHLSQGDEENGSEEIFGGPDVDLSGGDDNDLTDLDLDGGGDMEMHAPCRQAPELSDVGGQADQAAYADIPFTPRPPPSRGRAVPASPSVQNPGRVTSLNATRGRTLHANTNQTDGSSVVRVDGCPNPAYNGKYTREDGETNGACYYKSKHRSPKGSAFFIYRTRTRQWALCVTESAMKRGQANYRTVTSSWGLILPCAQWEKYGSQYRKQLVRHCGRWRKCPGLQISAVVGARASTPVQASATANGDGWVPYTAPLYPGGDKATRWLFTGAEQGSTSDQHGHIAVPSIVTGPLECLPEPSWEAALFDALEADDPAAVRAAYKRPKADPNARVVDDGRIKRGYFNFGKGGYRYNGKYEKTNPLDYLTPKAETGISAFGFLGMRVQHNDTLLDLAHRNNKSHDFRQAIREVGGLCENMVSEEVAELNQLGGARKFRALFHQYDPCALFGRELELIIREAKQRGLTDGPAIEVMLKNIESGVFVEDHFTAMWKARIRKDNAHKKLISGAHAAGKLSSVVRKMGGGNRRRGNRRGRNFDPRDLKYLLRKNQTKSGDTDDPNETPEHRQLKEEFGILTGKNQDKLEQHKLFQILMEFEKTTEDFVDTHQADKEFTEIFGAERRQDRRGKLHHGLKKDDLHEIFREVDVDGDGIIDLEEFKAIIGEGYRLQKQKNAAQTNERRTALQGGYHTVENYTTGAKGEGGGGGVVYLG